VPAGSPDRRSPLVFAHRGSSAAVAEHTLAAYLRAIDEGADGLECDVRLTRDGHLVCLHDRRINRTSDGRGLVSTRTLAELNRLDFGSWHPGLPDSPDDLIRDSTGARESSTAGGPNRVGGASGGPEANGNEKVIGANGVNGSASVNGSLGPVAARADRDTRADRDAGVGPDTRADRDASVDRDTRVDRDPRAASDPRADFDARSRVLTFDRLLDAAHDAGRDIRLLVETKHPTRYGGAVEAALVAALRKHGLDRSDPSRPVQVTVMSFSALAVRRIRRLAPEVPTVMLLEFLPPGLRVATLPFGTPIGGPGIRLLRSRPEIAVRLRERGYPVYVWTVNNGADLDLVLSLGVEGIISDRPGFVVSRLRELGLRG
jgi:glycerophosphoryl diester phosphodiesterase